VAQDDRWEIALCGAARASGPGERVVEPPGRQGRLLLAYLVCNRERGCPRAELIDLLWPEDPPHSADTALSALLSKLRRALGPGVLTGRAELRLALAGKVLVDIEAAEAAADRAAVAAEAGDWTAAAAHARAALRVDLQAFLPDAAGLWAAARRRECESVRLTALEALAAAGVRLGGRELTAAVQAARAAIEAAPFRESAHCLLMEAHEAAGNQAEALRAFEDLRVLLRDELGTAPGPAALAVHRRLLAGEAPPAPARPPAPDAVRWPQPLAAALGRHALVGRATELAFLEGCRERAAEDVRQLVLLAGDAGIGKTRTAAEFARRAHDGGAVVLYGRFDEQTTAPYQPLVEMLRGWSAGTSLEPLRERLGSRAAELGILLPEFGPPPSGAPPALRAAGADVQRVRFFDAVAAVVGEIGAHAQVVMVFDDVHWADRPTLQLLRYLVRSPQPRGALFVGAYRAAELDPAHPLHELVGDLRREGTLKRLELTGLEEREVGELVGALGAREPAPGFVAALHGETEGNPFFIEEVVRHLRESDGEFGAGASLEAAGVPEGVREVTARRVQRLSADAQHAVRVASVIGREFDFELLERVGPVTGDALVGALEEAAEARVLREAGPIGRYVFAHALVRATLYDGISRLRRARLHGRVGEALAELRTADLDPYLPQLAHHFAEAAPVGTPERAIDFALAAARRAARLFAWEEAAQLYRTALQARDLAGEADDRLRCELLLALGEAEERAGQDDAGQATFLAAADTARGLGDAALLGRAALGFAGPWAMLGRVDPARVQRLEEALAALGDQDTPLRARLLARLALELYYLGDPEPRLALTAEAVAIAHRIGDPRTIAACLDARHYALWRPETVEERLAVAGELRRVAELTGDPELELEGAAWTVVDLLELGDVQGADVQIAAASELAEALHRPVWLWWTSGFRCARAQLAGDFEAAEALAQETLAIGQRGQAENAVHYYAQAIFNIRREQGRLDEVEDAVRQLIALYPAIPAWRTGLALLLVELGRMDEARAEFDALAAVGFESLPRDANWLIGVTLLAEVCGALRDGERAPALYALLEPYAGRNVVVGRAATCNGSASRLLGILAATMRRWDEAERHFADALEMHERIGARPWQARTLVALAEMCLLRRARGDKARARGLLADAVVLADAVGMPALGERARALVPAGPAGPGGGARAGVAARG
jgi:DNA-binding SARP family transcriptional activator